MGDGYGFSEEDLDKVFVRFYKGKKGNFGLRLPITKSIVESHNGKITVCNSELGAKFTIELTEH